MRIDHAIIGARDIEAVADRLWERHGLASLPGGRHPGWGTHNRIVPLAGSYLEIIGVADENEALRDPMGRWLLANTATGDPLMAWCCETADIERLSRRLGPHARARRARPQRRRAALVARRGPRRGARSEAVLHRVGRPRDAARPARARPTPSRCSDSLASRSAARRGSSRAGSRETCPCGRSATARGCARS